MTHFLFVCVCSWGGMWVEVCVCVCGGGGIYLQLARFSSLSAKVSLLMPPHLLHTHTQIHILNYHTLKIIVCVCVCVCVTVWRASAACLAALHAPAVHRLQHEKEKALSPPQSVYRWWTAMSCDRTSWSHRHFLTNTSYLMEAGPCMKQESVT